MVIVVVTVTAFLKELQKKLTLVNRFGALALFAAAVGDRIAAIEWAKMRQSLY